MTEYYKYRANGYSGSLLLDEHGGDCCGRKHISNFPHSPNNSVVKALKAALNDCYGRYDEDEDEYLDTDYKELCVEITLNQYQYETTGSRDYEGKTWDEVLTKEFGFERVYRFRNPNTGNVVNVYMYSSNKVG